MRIFPTLLCGLAALSLSGVAAANKETDDGFIWIDANTRIKVKKVSTAAGGASAAEKAPKKAEKKEKPKK